MSTEENAAVAASNANAARLESRLEKIETTVAGFDGRMIKAEGQMDALVVELRQISTGWIRFNAILETILGFAKLLPVFLTLAALLLGGILWLIKHA